mmetsp:Transcript_2974/g.7594  ORF Transcript_2974/g.7594 Transcript_2974/m.7594 type:complete len:245 (-) Transcript_2974:298-1032(-)
MLVNLLRICNALLLDKVNKRISFTSTLIVGPVLLQNTCVRLDLEKSDCWKTIYTLFLALRGVLAWIPGRVKAFLLLPGDKGRIHILHEVFVPLNDCFVPLRLKMLAMRTGRSIVVHHFHVHVLVWDLWSHSVNRWLVVLCGWVLGKIHQIPGASSSGKLKPLCRTRRIVVNCGKAVYPLRAALLIVCTRVPILVKTLLLLPHHLRGLTWWQLTPLRNCPLPCRLHVLAMWAALRNILHHTCLRW